MRVLVLASAVASALILGCNKSQPPAPDPSASSPTAATARPAPPPRDVHFVALYPSGGTERSPLIVAFHGRGDTPENFATLFADLPAAAEVLVPRGIYPAGDGFAWYNGGKGGDDAAIASDLRTSVATVWPAVKARANGRPIIVTGFSQGGAMAFALARLHPTEVAHAFPIAGWLPPPLLPARGAPPPAPTDAYHGDADDIIPNAEGRRVVDSFQAAGTRAAFHSYFGVRHTVMPMRDDIFDALVAATR